MANELDYVLRMNATAFTGPLRGALGSVREVDAGTRRLGSSVDGIRTSMTNAGAGAESLFDKLGRLGANLSNVVNGVKSANEVLGFLRQRGQAAAAANTAVAATSAAAAASTRGVGVAATAAGAGLGVMAGGALGAAAALGTMAAVAVPVAAAMGALTAGVAAAGLAYKGAIKGVSLAADLEQDMIAFKTLTGSMRTAKDVLSELTSMASATPFQLPDLTGAARTLLAAKVPVQALRSELTALGNISAATGARIGSLATVFGQVAGKGKLYAEELQQFVEQGAGALRGAVAETLGVTTAQLMEMMQKGQVGFSALQQAIQRLAGASGAWANAMREQSQTTWGLLSTVKDNVDGIFRAFGQPINDGPVKAALQELVRMSETTKEMLVSALGNGDISETLRDAFVVGLNSAVKAALEGVQEIAEALAELSSPKTAVMKVALAVMRLDLDAGEAMARLQQKMNSAQVRVQIQAETDEKGRRVAAALAKSGSGPAPYAKVLDATDKPEDEKESKGGGDAAAKASNAMAVLQRETAIMLARAKGQNALADAMQVELDIAKEAKQIMEETNATASQAFSIALRRAQAQKTITDAAEAEAEARKNAEKAKADAKTANAQNQALESLKAEFAILQAKATGQNQLADALQREVDIRNEAKRIAEATGMADEKALQLARAKAGLKDKVDGKNSEKQKDSRYGEDGRRLTDGRKKIMGFSREKAGLPAFGGDGLLGGFRGRIAPNLRIGLQSPRSAPGITPPGVAKEQKTRKQQEEAAAKAVQPRWDLVEQIQKQLSGLGLM